MMTLNNIKGLFQSIASAHYQIQGFGFGNLFEKEGTIKPGITYKVLWVVPLESITLEQVKQRKLLLLVADQLKEDKSNRDEVWSDCEQIMDDVIKILRNESEDYELIGEPALQPVDEKHGDWIAGMQTEIVLQTQFNSNYCDIPSANISSPVSVPGYVQIRDLETGALVATPKNGETYYITILTTVEQSLGTVTPTIIQVLT